MDTYYVEQHDEGYWVSGSRVSLESVVFLFLDGLSPETIVAECFPILTLEQVYGAITYYLSHRATIDEYLKRVEGEIEALRHATSDPVFTRKLAQIRREMQTAKP